MLFRAQHGRSSKEANFSTLPELGQAEIVPWKPYKASQFSCWAHLSTGGLGKGAALAHRESVRSAGPLKLFPVRLTLAGGVVLAGLIRSRRLINSLTCRVLARCPKNEGVNS